jgi:hypothetical protein
MRRSIVLLAALMAAGAGSAAAQGIGRPPLFDAGVASVQWTLQFEGAVGFDEDAPWFGSTGLRVRRDWPEFALAAGAGLLTARDPGYVLSLGAQYKPGRVALNDGDERVFWLTGGPILDIARMESNVFGNQLQLTGALAGVLMLGFPGLTGELSFTPRYEVRSVHSSGVSESGNSWGIQTGAVLGVARFVQLLFTVDWAERGVRPAGPFEDSQAWSVGVGLRTRLPGT